MPIKVTIANEEDWVFEWLYRGNGTYGIAVF